MTEEAPDELVVSWADKIDYCLTQAEFVLEVASDHLRRGVVNAEEVECAGRLAHAWRLLGEAWVNRTVHQLALVDALAELESESEESDDDGDEGDEP